MSRKYCENEFLLDTKHLLNKIKDLNENNSFGSQNIHLFTLDVEKLYPSIQPALAEEALHDLLSNIDEEDAKAGEAVEAFVNLSFKESYIAYKNQVFKPKVGIPTGGSLSRQIADIFLHWLLFKKIDTSIMTANELRFWSRFIDDGIGIWRGSRRSFDAFINKLNRETNKFGINFPLNEFQFGKTVHFLDVTLYLDDENKIQFKSYTKPTDAKRYLRPQSFHPKSVFTSVPLSQMIRTIERNSTTSTEKIEMEKMMADFVRSGYDQEELKLIERRAREQLNTEKIPDDRDVLTFPIFYFQDINTFRKIIKEAEPDLTTIIGDTKVIFAVKKNPSIGNTVVKNKLLSFEEKQLENQKCGGPGCMQCPLVNTNATETVNNKRVKLSRSLNCKARNVIYLWQCRLCNDEDSYFGRTVQKTHERTNHHRSCFNEEKWEESALSMHSKTVHAERFSLANFKISLIKKVSPQRIRREEFKYIDKYRTRTRGINRYKN